MYAYLQALENKIINNNKQHMSQKGVDIPLRVYADGVFDSFHIGHANMFKQCRESFPGKKIWLIAGVCDQEDIQTFKGPTISTQEQRIAMCGQCRWVDQVIPHAPWIITEQFINQKFIDFVCHDDAPYITADVDDAYATCKKLGKFVATQRTENVSTTDVVTKILYNKQMYYIRNIKRGVSRSKLGISLIRYIYLRSKIFLCPSPEHDYKKKK